MDPNETLSMIVEALDNGDYDDAREHAWNLRSWLNRRGATPIGCNRAKVYRFCGNVITDAAAVTPAETCIGE